MSKYIYLDHNATTAMRPAATRAVVSILKSVGNPSSVHKLGREARKVKELARTSVAELVNGLSEDVIFTSGGTEANNLALIGCGRARRLISAVEHSSVLNAGGEVIAVDENGLVDLDRLSDQLCSDSTPALVSVMLANNETGVIEPIKDIVEMKIDVERRENLKAYHSATHLLHESLRRTLGKHVMQKGSLVAPDRLRFDFSHMKPITNEELVTIDKLVNEYVMNSTDVTTRIMTPKAAIEKGALAFFGEKYGEEVRVVSMGKEKDKYFSTELCGGTHVKNTGDIGKFKTVSQSSIAAGVRRVEALRDKQLDDFIKNKEKLSTLSTQKDEENIKELSAQIIKLGGKPNVDNKDLKEIIKNLTRQLEQLNVSSVLKDKTKNIINDENIKNIKVRFQTVKDLPPKDLRKLVDNGKKELGEGIIIVFASSEDKVGLAVGITEKLIDRYDAVKFAKLGSEIIGGKGGGGRKDFAQAGGQDKNKINEAFEKIKSLI